MSGRESTGTNSADPAVNDGSQGFHLEDIEEFILGQMHFSLKMASR
jgi:hypothetical protein